MLGGPNAKKTPKGAGNLRCRPHNFRQKMEVLPNDIILDAASLEHGHPWLLVPRGLARSRGNGFIQALNGLLMAATTGQAIFYGYGANMVRGLFPLQQMALRWQLEEVVGKAFTAASPLARLVRYSARR